MAFFVVRSFDDEYLTNRKATRIMYEDRSTWSKNLDDAKVFSTKSAASNSANQNATRNYQVIEVNLTLGEIVKTQEFEDA